LQYLAPEAEMQERKTDNKDRRRSPRLEVNDGVTGRIKPTIEVQILNISEHGMLIEAPCGLHPAAKCELTVIAPSGTRVLKGRVARCRAQMVQQDDGSTTMRFRAGIEFPEDIAEGLDVQELMSEICTLETPIDEATTKVSTAGIEQAM
jgi:hypothetical protein